MDIFTIKTTIIPVELDVTPEGDWQLIAIVQSNEASSDVPIDVGTLPDLLISSNCTAPDWLMPITFNKHTGRSTREHLVTENTLNCAENRPQLSVPTRLYNFVVVVLPDMRVVEPDVGSV